MSNPISVILRFNGDPHDLLGRFEQARKSWIEAQDEGYNPATFFAICKAEDGIVLVTGWEAEEDHKAFRKQMMPHLTRLALAGQARTNTSGSPGSGGTLSRPKHREIGWRDRTGVIRYSRAVAPRAKQQRARGSSIGW